MPTVSVTVPPSASEEIATHLVEARLAAGVNSVPCTSTYRWEGEVRHSDEAILLIRTTDERYHEVVERVREMHPYEVAPIERYDESDAAPAYAAWRARSVGPERD